MVDLFHPNLVAPVAIHPASFVQTTDPGPAGPDKLWLDTSLGTSSQLWILKKRNAANTGWDTLTPQPSAVGQILSISVGAPFLAAPTLPGTPATTVQTGGTILAGVYTGSITYVNNQGETIASATFTITTIGTTSTITVTSPAALGTNSQAATGWYAYLSQVGGSTLHRQQALGSPTAIGTNFTITAPPTSTGSTPPGSNTAGTLLVSWVGSLTEQSVGDLKITGLTGATTTHRLVGATTLGPPITGTFNAGDVETDLGGTEWICLVAGSPGTWGPVQSGASKLWMSRNFT